MAEIFWGKSAKAIYLGLAALFMLFVGLGGREIWTQEHRWADIVSAMLYYKDYLHPSLNGTEYYDKPLLSYWLIILVSKITGSLSAFALRLPSAFAGLLAVWSIYRLGTRLKDRELGLLAGWMLITTFYVVFWARTSSTDMLNMAGTLFAVQWYFETKNRPGLFAYSVFFLILAVTALCKGLVGPVVAMLVIFPDLLWQSEWKKHLSFKVIIGLFPAMMVYVIPFVLSSYYSNHAYHENGFYLVYRENILRYFQPFDHKGSIFTYFEFLPLYLFPWTLFFIPCLFSIKKRWALLSRESKWLIGATLLLFLFLTLSGSRRNYYVLPLVPFALLLTADWIIDALKNYKHYVSILIISSFSLCFLNFGILQPLYYAEGGNKSFAEELKKQTDSLSNWQYVMLDPESKVRFYLQLDPGIKNYSIKGKRNQQTKESLLEAWPLLKNPNPNTILISRREYLPMLKTLLPHYQIIEAKKPLGERLLGIDNPNLPIAFVPNSRV